MRKTSVLVVALAVATILVGSAPASAQNQPVVLDNYMAWWDQVGSPPTNAATQCAAMIAVVNVLEINAYIPADGDTPRKPTQPPTATNAHVDAVITATDDFQRWCVMWSGLSTKRAQDDADALMRGVTRGAHRITTTAADNVFDVRGWWTSLSATGQQVAIGATAAPTVTYPAAGAEQNKVNAAYAALMGAAMPPTPTPAVPLVGVLGLGLLLAGRGAYLRLRRRE